MKCAKCGGKNFDCIDTRRVSDTIRRRKVCLDCGYRFSTQEISIEEYHDLKRKESFVFYALPRLEEVMKKLKGDMIDD